MLDLACGQGRHALWLCRQGHAVTAVDRSAAALDTLRIQPQGDRVETIEADIEGGPWPLMRTDGHRRFDAVVVTNYLWRPLWPLLLGSLADGGVLLYETFAEGQASVGRPSRAEFLLRPAELLQVCQPLRVIAYEDGFASQPQRFVQRIAAVHAGSPDPTAAPRRYPLTPPV